MFSSHFNVADFSVFAVVTLFTLLAVLFTFYNFRKASKVSSIPGPATTNTELGNLGDMHKAGSLFQYMQQLHKTYGKIVSFWWGKTYTVSVACPTLWKDIKHVFDRPPELFKLFEPLFGKKSITYKNGAEGRERNKQFDRSFSHSFVMNYFGYFIEEAVKMTEEDWSSVPEGQHIPVHESMVNLSIRSIGRAGLGKIFKDDKEVKMFADAYKICWNELEAQLGAPPPEKGSDRQKQFEKANKYMRSVVKNLIESKRKNPEDVTEKLFIDSLMEGQDQVDEEELEDDTMTVMVAGFHTTAAMMTWCFYYLALYPEIQENVYQELKDVLGDEEIQPSVTGELKYCRQVLDETLRCAVIAPWGARVQMDHDIQIGEYLVQKETPILIPYGVVLQDPEIYPEPQRFDPDRFNEENCKERPSLAYQPFGFAGKRKCPGWRYSLAGGLVFLSVFFRKFKVKLVEGQKVEPVHRLVTAPKEEFYITVSKR